jgi:tol-pal system protein YbgF
MRMTRSLTAPLLAPLLALSFAVSAPSARAEAPKRFEAAGASAAVVEPDPTVQRLQIRVETLETMVRKMTGEVESLRQQATMAQNEAATQRALADELTARIVALEQAMKVQAALGFGFDPAAPAAATAPTASAPASPGGGPAPAAPKPLTESQLLLRDGQFKLVGADFAGAAVTFQDVMTKFPGTSDATEARFWLGETQYLQADYANAAGNYLAIVQKAPKNARAPDAMIKLGASLRELGNKTEACSTLSQVTVKYPKASAAVKAKLKSEKTATGCKG